jgi:hypothetical protein
MEAAMKSDNSPSAIDRRAVARALLGCETGTMTSAEVREIVCRLDHAKTVAERKATERQWAAAEACVAQCQGPGGFTLPDRPRPSALVFALRPLSRRTADVRRRWRWRAL